MTPLASPRKSRSLALNIGLILIGAGLIFVGLKSSGPLGEWFARLWPIFLILAGVIRLIGFAVSRRPASPFAAMLLILAGVAVMAVRANAGSSFLELYGRYWPSILLLYGAIELTRFYSHKRSDGAPPKVFSVLRVILILSIIATGVIASRLPAQQSGVRGELHTAPVNLTR